MKKIGIYTTIGISLAGLLIANYAIKLGRVYPLIKKAFVLIKNTEEAKKDKVLTDKEKAGLYDNIVDLIKTAHSIIRGLFPNK